MSPPPAAPAGSPPSPPNPSRRPRRVRPPSRAVPDPAPAYEPATTDRRTGRSRALLAGVALALVGVGGIGGYAIGATTSGGDEPTGSCIVGDGDHAFGVPRTASCRLRGRIPGWTATRARRRPVRRRRRRRPATDQDDDEDSQSESARAGVERVTLAPPVSRRGVPPPRPVAPRGRDTADAATRTAAAGALWLSLLLVTFWWVADGGVTDLTGWATGLTSVGRLIGLVASVLLLVQVLLMARVPVLERAFGQDRLAALPPARRVHLLQPDARPHRPHHLGLRRRSADRRTPATLWDLTVDYPGMLLAAAGTAGLVMVVVTSIKAARGGCATSRGTCCTSTPTSASASRCRTSSGPGSSSSARPAAPCSGGALWVAAAGAVLVWRVGAPARGAALRHRLRVTSVVPRGRRRRVGVRRPGAACDRLPRRGRAVLHLAVPRRARAGPARNPYSLSAAPDGRSLRITVKDARRRQRAPSRSLAARARRVLVEGPYGRLSAAGPHPPQGRPDRRRRRHHAAARAGRGAGLRARARRSCSQRYTTEPLFARELARPRRERGLHVVRLPGHRRGAGLLARRRHRAPSTTLTALLAWVPDLAERDVYVCGPTPGPTPSAATSHGRRPARTSASTSRPSGGDPDETYRPRGS